jgi:hypothetical protein
MATLERRLDVPEADALTVDPRWQIVGRIRKGALHNSPRLQQLLAYLCERALCAPAEHLSEDAIGVAVFGRPPGYDTSIDTIVRVQVSQLRRKLGHYFVAEGRHEPIVIELPRGSYLPRFHPRPVDAEAPPPAPTPTEVAAPSDAAPPTPPRAWIATSVLLALLCGGLVFDNVRLRRTPPDATPHVTHFWRQLASGGRPTQIVLSDVGLAQLSDVLGRSVTLGEYRKASYPFALSDGLAVEPRIRGLLDQSAIKGFTSSHDARIARDVSAMLRGHGASVAVVSARDVQIDLGTPENLVLLGSRRANPWMELFEADLPFRYQFDERHRTASIVNLTSQPGEPPAYSVQWGRRSYVVVALLPKPRGEGDVLLVYAADFHAAAAGGQFLMDETALAALHSRLGAGLDRPLPYFAALLRAELAGNSVTNYELVAHRLYERGLRARS